MGWLEQAEQMRSQGKTDDEIISDLKKQKVSPKDIKSVMDHLDIKRAVGNTVENNGNNMPTPPSPGQPQNQNQGQSDNPPQNMQQENNNQNYNENGNAPYEPQGPENYNQGGGYDYGGNEQPAYYNSQDAQQQGYYQQPYQEGEGYAPQETGSDTMVEISEQVFEEKIRGISKKIDSFEEFRTLSQTRIDHMNDRLKRIESVIDKLQSAILEKIGSYGRDVGEIKKEMSMMQDTFTRTMDHKSGNEKKAEKKSSKPKSQKKSSEKK